MTTRSGLPTFTVRGFGGGLNKAVSSFKLRDDELRDCQNVRVDLKGSLKPRAGLRRYDTSGAHLLPSGSGLEVKGIYRYTNSTGLRKFIIQQSLNAFLDANDGVFVAGGSVPKSPDGFSRFCQWKNTVYAVGLTGTPAVYNPVFGSAFVEAQSRGAMDRDCVFDLSTVVSGGGSWTVGNDHSYRFTVDYQLNDDYLCESFPLHESATDAVYGSLVRESLLGDHFWSVVVENVSATDNTYQITKGSAAGGWNLFAFPSQAKSVNVYRSLGVPTATTAAELLANSYIIGTQYYWIGSFDVATFTAAAIGDVLFTDYGDPPSSGIMLSSQSNFERVPPARFSCIYKGRLWIADVTAEIPDVYTMNAGQYDKYNGTFTTKTVNNASRVYFSRAGEPGAIGFQSWQPIQETDGEGITGLVSWKNRALFVFKPNNITGIYGGDEELVPGIPDIETELVDEAVGCIAPNSLALGEGGIMFLSNRGVMFFDGTKPESLQSKLIDPILETIQPERRQYAAGVYDNHNRKYLLAISTTEEEAAKNNVVLEYDFFTNTWTKHVYMDGSAVVFGFNQFVEMKCGDETQRLVATCDNAAGYQEATGAVQLLDDVYYESVSFTDIVWNAKTKYFDCGEPDRVKTFMALLVRVKTPQPMYVDYDVDEGSVEGSLTITTTANHVWDEVNLNWQGALPNETLDHFWGAIVQGETLLRFPQNVCGRRIGFTFRGNSHLPDTEIQGFSIKFVREDRDEV